MTAPAINGTRYPQPVEDLLPAARELKLPEGQKLPSRNRLMREFRVGAAKADALRSLLMQESVHRDLNAAKQAGKRAGFGIHPDAVPPATVTFDYAQPIGPDPVVPERVPLIAPDPAPLVKITPPERDGQVAEVSHPGTPTPTGTASLTRRGRRQVERDQQDKAARDALMKGQTRRVEQWTAKAAEARQLRRLLMDPDVQAVRLMRQRARWTVMAWSALLFALAFTMVNVQRFAAGNAEPGSPTWLVAWLVDPAFSILLVGLLIARGQLSAVGRNVHETTVRRVEYALLASTAAMNIMPTLTERYPGGWPEQGMQVLLHLLIPGLAFASALVITLIQDHFAAAIATLTDGETA